TRPRSPSPLRDVRCEAKHARGCLSERADRRNTPRARSRPQPRLLSWPSGACRCPRCDMRGRPAMSLELTFAILLGALAIAVLANWRERRPRDIGRPPLVPLVAVQAI